MITHGRLSGLPSATARVAHSKVILEVCVLCWVLGMSVLATLASAEETQRLAIDAGYRDLLRAHNERAAVTAGRNVIFHKYVVVKVLDQFFTVGNQIPEGGRYAITNDGNTKTIVIY